MKDAIVTITDRTGKKMLARVIIKRWSKKLKDSVEIYTPDIIIQDVESNVSVEVDWGMNEASA